MFATTFRFRFLQRALLAAAATATLSAQSSTGVTVFGGMVAAGVRTDSPAGPQQGAAPGAHLGVCKVFDTTGISTCSASHAVIAAIDDAGADGMDILNPGLVFPAATPWEADPTAVAAQSAVADLGRVAVAAAGDSAASGPYVGTPVNRTVARAGAGIKHQYRKGDQ